MPPDPTSQQGLPEASWPQKGETLFSDSDPSYRDPRYVACVNWSGDDWEGYAHGYRLAGDILTAYIREASADQDFLVFPILFNYRHSAEIRMKQTIRAVSLLLETHEAFEDTHDLRRLWGTLRVLVRRVWPDQDRSAIDAVTDQFKELNQLDPQSTAFRYPEGTAKDGRRASLPSDLLHINLALFSDRMTGLLNLLDGIHTGIIEYLHVKSDADEYRREMQAEYRREMQAEYRQDL